MKTSDPTDRPPTPVIGITGGIGSGKTAVTDRLATKGICIVDADVAARRIMMPGGYALTAVVDRYGDGLLLQDGNLDRAALRRIVFEDPAERDWLESLSHPLIGEAIQQDIQQADSPYVVLASPLLLETQQAALCDEIVVVDVPESVQLARTMQRDSNDAEQVKRIMAAQLPREERLAKADRIIHNDGSLDELFVQVDALDSALRDALAH